MKRKSIALADVAAVFNGKTPSTAQQRLNGHPVLKIKDVNELGQFIGRFDCFVDPDLALSLKAKQLQDGDVLILNAAHNADYVGSKMYWSTPDVRNALPTGEWLIVRGTSTDVEKRYLYYWLHSTSTKQQIRQLVKGIHLYPSDVAELEFELIPIEEQKAVVDTLDAIDRLIRLRRLSTETFNKLSTSLFLKFFGEPLKNPHGFKVEKLEDLGTLDRGRSRNRPRNLPELYGGPYPFIQTGDIANCDGYIQDFVQTYSEQGLAQSKLWPKGTLCITIAANIGKTGILTFPACFPDSVVGFTPNKSSITEYIQYWLRLMQEELERKAPESAQKNINLEILREQNVMVPPLALQKRFGEAVRALEKAKIQQLESEKQAGLLFQTAMAKAFDKHSSIKSDKKVLSRL